MRARVNVNQTGAAWSNDRSDGELTDAPAPRWARVHRFRPPAALTPVRARAKIAQFFVLSCTSRPGRGVALDSSPNQARPEAELNYTGETQHGQDRRGGADGALVPRA